MTQRLWPQPGYGYTHLVTEEPTPLTRPQPREEKLPGWARTLLSRLRGEMRTAIEEAERSKAAAEVLSGNTDAGNCAVVAVLPDGETLGLPEDVRIEFKAAGIEVFLDAGEVTVGAGSGSIAVIPCADFIVQVVRR